MTQCGCVHPAFSVVLWADIPVIELTRPHAFDVVETRQDIDLFVCMWTQWHKTSEVRAKKFYLFFFLYLIQSGFYSVRQNLLEGKSHSFGHQRLSLWNSSFFNKSGFKEQQQRFLFYYYFLFYGAFIHLILEDGGVEGTEKTVVFKITKKVMVFSKCPCLALVLSDKAMFHFIH